MRNRIRRLISRLAGAMHAELKSEIRGQHKQALARAAETDRTLASSTRALEAQMARGARTQKRLERMLREVSQRQHEMRLMLLQTEGARRSRRANGPRIPPTAAGLTPPDTTSGNAAPRIPAEAVAELSACPVCESRTYTDVCEYNKLLLQRNALLRAMREQGRNPLSREVREELRYWDEELAQAGAYLVLDDLVEFPRALDRIIGLALEG